MELPSGLAALVADLEQLDFRVVREESDPWPGGRHVELARPRGQGIGRVRMTEDRSVWDIEVKIGTAWCEPFMALLALDGVPHRQRALSHAERRAATLDLVQRFTGDPAQAAAIKQRQKELSEAYTRWAEGKSDVNPLA